MISLVASPVLLYELLFLLFIKIYVLNSPNDISHEISLNMRKKISIKYNKINL